MGILGAAIWPMTKKSLKTLVLDGVIASCNRFEEQFRTSGLIMYIRVASRVAGFEEHGRATHAEMFIMVIHRCLGIRKEWELGWAVACFICFPEQDLISTMEIHVVIIIGRGLKLTEGGSMSLLLLAFALVSALPRTSLAPVPMWVIAEAPGTPTRRAGVGVCMWVESQASG